MLIDKCTYKTIPQKLEWLPLLFFLKPASCFIVGIAAPGKNFCFISGNLIRTLVRIQLLSRFWGNMFLWLHFLSFEPLKKNIFSPNCSSTPNCFKNNNNNKKASLIREPFSAKRGEDLPRCTVLSQGGTRSELYTCSSPFSCIYIFFFERCWGWSQVKFFPHAAEFLR